MSIKDEYQRTFLTRLRIFYRARCHIFRCAIKGTNCSVCSARKRTASRHGSEVFPRKKRATYILERNASGESEHKFPPLFRGCFECREINHVSRIRRLLWFYNSNAIQIALWIYRSIEVHNRRKILYKKNYDKKCQIKFDYVKIHIFETIKFKN